MRAFRQGRQRVAGDHAVMLGAGDRVGQSAVAGDEAERLFEVLIVALAALDGIPPESPVFRRAAPVGQDDGQGDLAFAEIIDDILAELG